MTEVQGFDLPSQRMTGQGHHEAPPTVNLYQIPPENTSVETSSECLSTGPAEFDDPEMEQFLRPSTLFRPSNFRAAPSQALANHA